MRRFMLACAALGASAATAAEIPITAIYGTPAGCAYLLGNLPDGPDFVAVTSRELITFRAVCTYETVEAAADGWRVAAACAAGENTAYRLRMEVVRLAEALRIATTAGDGPTGEYAECRG